MLITLLRSNDMENNLVKLPAWLPSLQQKTHGLDSMRRVQAQLFASDVIGSFVS